jgi:4-hydroxybenzoate polyprenyltransferase
MTPIAANADRGEAWLPLAVDMDSTLLRTDTLWEQFVALLFHRPLTALWVCLALPMGRARFKARLARQGALDAAALPFHEDFLAYLKQQRARGRGLHLVTAASRDVADQVAAHVGLFQSVEASDDDVNLKGARKAEHLTERFPRGFAYAGDHVADLKVWAAADAIVLVSASPAVTRKAKALGKPVEAEFARGAVNIRVWLKAMRIHQWAKNILVFAPLLLAHRYRDLHADGLNIVAFVSFGLVASATYLINDLSDLPADRAHAKKKNRPFASGALPISKGVFGIAVLLLVGFGLAAAASTMLVAGLAAYVVLTLAYTFRLKRLALFDVVTLGLLYTLRIAVGSKVTGAPMSVWLLTFSMFFFFSISLAKRYAEIFAMVSHQSCGAIAGRGYRTADGPVVLTLGISSSIASVLIVVLYLTEEAFPSGVYHHHNWLWTAPFVLMLWTSRVWLLAGRGELDEDPVAFAIRDRFSLFLALPLLAAFVLAVLR